MQLPIITVTDNQPLMLLQTKWKAQLDPLLRAPLNSSNFLQNISLINGVTTLNHLLGRQMLGWYLVDVTAAATIFRSAPLNNLTLTLTSDAACTVSLLVF